MILVGNIIFHFSARGPYGVTVLHFYGSQPEEALKGSLARPCLLSSSIFLYLWFTDCVQVELLVRNFFSPVDSTFF